MQTLPHLVIKSTLIMVFLMVITCLALTNSTMQASSNASADGKESTDPEEVTNDGTSQGSRCELSVHFPKNVTQWCNLIVQYANQYDLPPDLIAALIWQESGGNPEAYSSSGAVGLMQVMPRDGLAANFTCINGPCFASRPTIDELLDPEYNIAYGTRFLAGLYDREQDLREALKRYGPHDMGYRYADIVLSLYSQASP